MRSWGNRMKGHINSTLHSFFALTCSQRFTAIPETASKTSQAAINGSVAVIMLAMESS